MYATHYVINLVIHVHVIVTTIHEITYIEYIMIILQKDFGLHS